MTRRIFLTLALILAPVFAFAQDLTGGYSAFGRYLDGTYYEGAVWIEDGATIRVRWNIDGQAYEGIGFRDGRVVVVDWGEQHPVIYVTMPNGELHGTWGNGQALEKLIPN